MTVVAKVPLGAGTLNRKWYLDVNNGTHAVPVWVGVFGISDFKPALTQTLQKNADFDSDWDSENVTALKFSLDFKVERKVKVADATAYDEGQEILRAASLEVGGDNQVEVRWYEYKGAAGGPEVEAYMGYAAVLWSEAGGGQDADSVCEVRLVGQGEATPITHPDATNNVPVVASVTPSALATAGGEAAVIYGQYFTGATDVEVDVTDVTDYVVLDDHHIGIVTPAKVAGTYVVYVTNANGESAGTGATVTYA